MGQLLGLLGLAGAAGGAGAGGAGALSGLSGGIGGATGGGILSGIMGSRPASGVGPTAPPMDLAPTLISQATPNALNVGVRPAPTPMPTYSASPQNSGAVDWKSLIGRANGALGVASGNSRRSTNSIDPQTLIKLMLMNR